MKITITISDQLPQQTKAVLMGKIWVAAASDAGIGATRMEHDGDPALTALANAEFDRWAQIHWK